MIEDGIENEFHKMLFLFLFETNARVSEILQVKISDIDFKYNKVNLITLKRKNKRITRVLILSDHLINKILLYEKKKSLENSDYLFSKKHSGKAISIQTVNKTIKKSILNCLGKEYTELAHPHTLRHSRAIQLLNSGVNIIHIKSILGHANIINTLIYLKYSNKDLQENINKANKLIGLTEVFTIYGSYFAVHDTFAVITPNKGISQGKRIKENITVLYSNFNSNIC